MTEPMGKKSDAGCSGCGYAILIFFFIIGLSGSIAGASIGGNVILFFAAIAGAILTYILVKEEKEESYSHQTK